MADSEVEIFKMYQGEFYPYDKAKAYMHALGITALNKWKQHWQKYGRQPVPAMPKAYYKEQFEDGEFYAKVTKIPQVYVSYEEAKTFARSIGAKTYYQWRTWCQQNKDTMPKNINVYPNMYYKEYDVKDFFPLELRDTQPPKKREYLKFPEVVKFVRSLNLKNYEEWKVWCKTNEPPEGIPRTLHQIYGKERYYHDLFPQKYLCYSIAKQFTRKLKICTLKEWSEWVKVNVLPEGMPRRPDAVYRGKFSVPDFFNARHWLREKSNSKKRLIKQNDAVLKLDKATASGYLPYDQAKAFIQSFGFTSVHQHTQWIQKYGHEHKEIPVRPNITYRDRWTGWADYIGARFNSQHFSDYGYCPYVEAKNFVQQLKLKTQTEWKEWCRANRDTRLDIPRLPQKAYRTYWEGWDTFLGVNLIDVVRTQGSTHQALFIAQEQGNPTNVFTIGIEPTGEQAVYESVLVNRRAKLFKIFTFQNQMANGCSTQDRINQIISNNGTPYLGEQSELWIIPNVHQLAWDLTDVCDETPIHIPRYVKYKLLEEEKREKGGIVESDGKTFGDMFTGM